MFEFQERRDVADRYRRLFEREGLGEVADLPVEKPGHFHVYNQFVIRVPADARDPLRDHLTAHRVGSEIYYPIPLHLQKAYAHLAHREGDFPVAERVGRECLTLPLFPGMTVRQHDAVVEALTDILTEGGAR